MYTFAKLKTGEVMRVYSDNHNIETMDLIIIDDCPYKKFEPCVDVVDMVDVPYSDILCTDTNFNLIKNI